jgi:hypothetical protein
MAIKEVKARWRKCDSLFYGKLEWAPGRIFPLQRIKKEVLLPCRRFVVLSYEMRHIRRI